jgi:hypothetical protein
MCCFIFYEGLLERRWYGQQRNVPFLYVRPWPAEKMVPDGRKVVMSVIRAAIEMIEKRRDKKEKERACGLAGCCFVI